MQMLQLGYWVSFSSERPPMPITAKNRNLKSNQILGWCLCVGWGVGAENRKRSGAFALKLYNNRQK